MTTEADREAAARVFDEIARKSGHPEVATLNRSYAQKIRAGDGDDFDAVRAAVNSRTASTAALTAEVERLNRVVLFAVQKEAALTAENQRLRDIVEAATQLVPAIFDNWHQSANAALSTPSEVSEPKAVEPVADHIGGEGEVRFVKPLAWSEPHASASYPMWLALDAGIRFEARIDTSEPLKHGKFPLSINGAFVDQQFETCDAAKSYAQSCYDALITARLTTPPNTNGDAVQEKAAPLGRHCTVWEWRNRGRRRWEVLHKEPDCWYLQMEYRACDSHTGEELWRSPHVNGYDEVKD